MEEKRLKPLELPSRKIVRDKYLSFMKTLEGSYTDSRGLFMTKLKGDILPVHIEYVDPGNEGGLKPLVILLCPMGGPNIIEGERLADLPFRVGHIYYVDENYYVELREEHYEVLDNESEEFI